MHSQVTHQISDPSEFRAWLEGQAHCFGFDRIQISDTYLGQAAEHLQKWINEGRHGNMEYMSRHVRLRSDPGLLHEGAIRVICVSVNYLPPTVKFENEWQQIANPSQAVVSMYARGRDYHKVLRTRLQDFANAIEGRLGKFGYRVFTDSAPLMEVELARKAGLGWRGKHTLLLNRESGSTFFLGEILVDIPLEIDVPSEDRCGSCQACVDICPTKAILAPYQLDARRCISYLTIENPKAIPIEFRRAIGNRIYGCDDCQLICPWNKYSKRTEMPDFAERHGLGGTSLLELWSWSESDFERRHEGSAIRRIGYSRWRRNLAVGMGNAVNSPKTDIQEKERIREALRLGLKDANEMVQEHIEWALT